MPAKSRATGRHRGRIEALPSGSLRVKVYAGTDPLSGHRHDLEAAEDDGTPVWAGEVTKTIARQLDDADVPANIGRDRTREACARLGIKAGIETLEDVIAYRKHHHGQVAVRLGSAPNLATFSNRARKSCRRPSTTTRGLGGTRQVP